MQQQQQQHDDPRSTVLSLTDDSALSSNNPDAADEATNRALWLVSEDPAAREELSRGLGVEAAERCESDESSGRVLQLLAHAVRVQCESDERDEVLTDASRGLAEAVCHLVVRRVVVDEANRGRNLDLDFAAADSIDYVAGEACAAFRREFGNSSHAVVDTLLEVLELIAADDEAEDVEPMVNELNPLSRYYAAPSLVLQDAFLRDPDDERRRDLVSLLATRLLSPPPARFGSESQSSTATPFEVQLTTPLLANLSQTEFDTVLAPRLKFKLLSDAGSTTVTIFAIVRVIIDSNAGNIDLFPHLEGGIQLVPAATRQLCSSESSSQRGLGSDLATSLLVAASSYSRRGGVVFATVAVVVTHLARTLGNENDQVSVGTADQLEALFLTLGEVGKTYMDLLADVGGSDVAAEDERHLSSFALDSIEHAERTFSEDEKLAGDVPAAREAADYALERWDVVLEERGGGGRVESDRNRYHHQQEADTAAPGATYLPVGEMDAFAMGRAKANAAASSAAPAAVPGVSVVRDDPGAGGEMTPLQRKLAGIGPAGNPNIAPEAEEEEQPQELEQRLHEGGDPPQEQSLMSLQQQREDAKLKHQAQVAPSSSYNNQDDQQMKRESKKQMMMATLINEGKNGPSAQHLLKAKLEDENEPGDGDDATQPTNSGQNSLEGDGMGGYDALLGNGHGHGGGGPNGGGTTTIASRGIIGSDPIVMEEGIAEEALPLAVAVEAEDLEDEMDDGLLESAEEFDPDAKPSIFRDRRFIGGSIFCFVAVVVVAISVSLSMTKKVVDSNPPAEPTCIKDDSGYYAQISSLSTEESLCTPYSPQYYAYHWTVRGDSLDVDPSAERDHLLQRYVLALLYFSTRGYNWGTCGGRLNTTTCQYQCFGQQCLVDERCEGERCTVGRYLSEQHECDWYGTVCDSNRKVIGIEFLSNNLHGSLPTEISFLGNLFRLSMPDNNLSGKIPASIGNMSSLADLNLKYNGLTGTVPQEIFNVTSLQSVDIGSNFLTGTLSPSWGKLQNLKALRVFNNSFGGPLPDEIGDLGNLEYLNFQRNQLTGPIPQSIGKLSKLRELLLDFNLFNRGIPAQIGDLANLEILQLNNNRLSKSVPDELFALDKLKFLYLFDNQLTGSLSPGFGQLTGLTRLILDGNRFDGAIPPELSNLRNLEMLWLHYNSFTGAMPEALCAIRRDEGAPESLYADCLGGSVECESDCCTHCCHKSLRQCFEN